MKTKKGKTGLDIFIEGKFADTKPAIKYGLFFVIFCVLGAVFYFVVYMSVMGNITTLGDKETETKSKIQEAQKTIYTLGEQRQKLAELKEQFDLLITSFPDENQLPSLLANISEIGRSAGLEFKLLKPEKEEIIMRIDPKTKKLSRKTKKNKPEDFEFYKRIPLKIEIQGSYYSFVTFLDGISKLERVVTIHDINMKTPKLEGSEMILNTNCTLSLYKYTETPEKKEQKK